jgi:general secretion pathway protein G
MLYKERAAVKRGFSIIELLAVISIISILSSIAVFNIASRAKLAKDAAVKNNLMILRGSVSRYYAVNLKFPDSLEALSGAELKSVLLKWDAANASGDIGYGRENGSVYLAAEGGGRAAGRDFNGAAYAEY